MNWDNWLATALRWLAVAVLVTVAYAALIALALWLAWLFFLHFVVGV